MIVEKLEILIVEDVVSDYKLIKWHVKKLVESPIITHVDSFDKLKLYLQNNRPSIVLSDYKMNGFNGLDVLNYVKEKTTIPYLVFITNTFENEELADKTILKKATGYILKKHMTTLNFKLAPYFKQIVEDIEIRRLPNGHQKMIKSINTIIQNANINNELHIKNANIIKNSLKKLGK